MKRTAHNPSARYLEAGFSLIEALVSIVILSFGMLGVLSLQMEALRGNQNASQSAVAVSLIRDYQEILTSMPSVTASVTANASISIDKNTYAGYSGSAVDCKGSGATCSNTQFANFQIKEWIERVKNDLPNGRVTVCFDNAYIETSGSAQGLYKWSCSDSGDILVLKMGWARKSAKNSTGTIIESGIDDGTDRPRMVIPLTGNQEGNKL
jgi:type IV pilus assembly protein PilV